MMPPDGFGLVALIQHAVKLLLCVTTAFGYVKCARSACPWIGKDERNSVPACTFWSYNSL